MRGENARISQIESFKYEEKDRTMIKQYLPIKKTFLRTIFQSKEQMFKNQLPS